MRIVRKEDIAKPFRGPLGEVIYEMIGRPEQLGGTTEHSFVYVVVPPAKCSPAHFHRLSEETYYVLSGEGRIAVRGDSRVLRAGDACLIMPGEVHQIHNDQGVPLEFIAVSAPAWTPDDTYPAER